MTSQAFRFIKVAVVLVILCLLSAGCISGKDTTSAAATPATATPAPTKNPAKLSTPLPTSSQVIVLDDGTKTCSQLKGTIAIPGQVCPGRWLTASDSFSCCSKNPVAGTTANPRLTVAPLDLRITHNDTFVDIGTG
ncbi:MAG: hypothetical protein WC593_06805 [Methanoregula sp.]